MKMILPLIRLFFRLSSAISPSFSLKKALIMFQTPIKKPDRSWEKKFYQKAHHLEIPGEDAVIHAYEMGNPEGEAVFLVHGWEGCAGNFGRIADTLSALGYRVIAFDLPAHGHSSQSRTNLFKASAAMEKVITNLCPDRTFSVISHSFGSAVTSYTLGRLHLSVRNLIFLTTPNRLEKIFQQFFRTIGISLKHMDRFKLMFEENFGQSLGKMNVEDFVGKIDWRKFIMVHDREDRAIPFRNSARIFSLYPDARLIQLDGSGHYRMLWEDQVMEILEETFSGEQKPSLMYSQNLLTVA